MREVLFKGKHFKTQEWIYGIPHFMPSGAVFMLRYANDIKTVKDEGNKTVYDVMFEFDEVIPETICQYTGLHDKNRVTIYEGDIIRNTANTHWDLQEVKYGDCRNWILDGVRNKPFKTSKCGCLISIEAQQIFEVIGNIFDNPELLTSEIGMMGAGG